MPVADLVDSKDLQVLKVAIHHQLQLQPTRLHRSHQTTKPQEVATTTPKLKTISQLDHQELLATHRKPVHQPDQDSQDLKLELALVHLTQEPPVVLDTHQLKDQMQEMPLTQLLANHNDQLDQLPEVDQQLLLDQLELDLELELRDQVLEVLDREPKVEAEAAADLHQANKMTAKKETTQPFPENQKSTTPSSQKSQKLRSTATNRNSQDTMLTLKPVAKFSTSAL
jgi:hypothetical protein